MAARPNCNSVATRGSPRPANIGVGLEHFVRYTLRERTPGGLPDGQDRQERHDRGREVNTSGDGFLAIFDGPQRAIRCAMAIRDAVQALGIEVRAGLHTGECEVRGDDIGGIAVHIGARVSALAGPNDVLVSSTLRDLVIGDAQWRALCGARP